MLPAEQDRFGVDDPATVGDVGVVLYALGIGDAPDPQEALDTLGQFGLLSDAGAVGDPISGEKTVAALSQFTKLVGASFPSSIKASEGGMTRGELAELVVDYLTAMGWIEG